jgi:hypothetical protein
MTLRTDALAVLTRARSTDTDALELVLTVKEYAAWRHIHVQTVYSAIRRERMPEAHRVERAFEHVKGSRIVIRIPRAA